MGGHVCCHNRWTGAADRWSEDGFQSVDEVYAGCVEMWELLWLNGFDGLDEVMNGCTEIVIGGWRGDRDGVVRHPTDCLRYSFCSRRNVPNPVTTVMTKAGTKVVTLTSMWVPRLTLGR